MGHLTRMARLVLLLAAAVAVTSIAVAQAHDQVICYYGSWAVWRPGDGRFDVDDIDPYLCTTLIFGFAGLSNHTWELEVLDPWNELCPNEEGGNNCAFDRFVALRDINPNLKILLAVGGWNEGSEDYSYMSEDPNKRATFIRSSTDRVLKHGFDGLDVDWEYPTQRGGRPQDKENFATLLDEFRVEFDKHGLILSAAVSAGKPTIDLSYDVHAIVRNMDMVHLMTYDFHGAWENETHHNAPLCGYPSDYGDMIYFRVDFALAYWLELGMPKEKIALGLAVYGRCFTLDSMSEHGMLAPAHKPGKPGPFARVPGSLGYNEICVRRQSEDCPSVMDPDLQEPYFYCKSDRTWCGYDDVDSIYKKAKYARNMGVAGVMVWTIDTDDFRGRCHPEANILIKTAKRALAEPPEEPLTCPPPGPYSTTPEPTTTTAIPTTTTQTTTTPTTTPPTTPEPTTTTTTTKPSTTPGGSTTTMRPGSRPNCHGIESGYYPHYDCNKYWVCENEQANLMQCSPGTLWDQDLHICNWESVVDTSKCNIWACMVDQDTYPALYCNEYYICYNGEPHLEKCLSGMFWSQPLHQCIPSSTADISSCKLPGT